MSLKKKNSAFLPNIKIYLFENILVLQFDNFDFKNGKTFSTTRQKNKLKKNPLFYVVHATSFLLTKNKKRFQPKKRKDNDIFTTISTEITQLE